MNPEPDGTGDFPLPRPPEGQEEAAGATSTTSTTTSHVEVASSRDPARLAALCGEWKELFDAAVRPSPFLSWEWLFTWWRAFGSGQPVWILEARERDATLAGIVVLSACAAPMRARRWRLLGNGVTGADFVDVLARPGREASVRSALARAMADAIDRWDVLDLEDLPVGSPTLAALRRALAPRGVRIEVEPGFVCPGFAVRGTFAEHLARVRRRETYGRRVRWLRRQPGFRIEVATAADASRAMDDFLRLHRLRWAAEGGSWGIPRGPAEDFHREVAPLLAARGWLRLYRLFVGNAAIAAVYGIEVGGRFFYYQSGYDPAWSARSPGIVLVGRTIEDAYESGLEHYDFLRGTEPYKLDWAWDRRETCAVRLRAPSLRAGAAAAASDAYRAARGLARAIAPAGVWKALSRARRGHDVDAMARLRDAAGSRGSSGGIEPGEGAHERGR